jgi:hypothetical protein
MRKVPGFVIALGLSLAGGAAFGAPSVPPAEDPRDKVIAKGTIGAVADWWEEPWWMALADCAAAFRSAPEDRAKVQTFATAAIAQVAKDRGIPLRDAGAVVMPYVTTGQGRQRAEDVILIYGGVDETRSRCDKVLVQYKAL